MLSHALRTLGLGSLTAFALVASPTLASALSITVGYDGTPSSFVTLTDQDPYLGCGAPGENGAFNCSGTNWSPIGGWTMGSWSITADPDPSVTNIISVTNNTVATQTFVISVNLPVGITFGPPSLIRGSIQGGGTDNNFNGVTITNSGVTSIYDAQIDGSSVRTLMDNPLSVSGVGSISLASQSFGIPVQESVAVATTSSIGLTLRFTLTAGDSASFTSVFDVQPVPEPGTALLFGLGLAGLAARRRN